MVASAKPVVVTVVLFAGFELLTSGLIDSEEELLSFTFISKSDIKKGATYWILCWLQMARKLGGLLSASLCLRQCLKHRQLDFGNLVCWKVKKWGSPNFPITRICRLYHLETAF